MQDASHYVAGAVWLLLREALRRGIRLQVQGKTVLEVGILLEVQLYPEPPMQFLFEGIQYNYSPLHKAMTNPRGIALEPSSRVQGLGLGV